MMRPEHAAVITNQEKYATAAKGTEPYVNEDFRKLYEASFPPAAIDNIKWYPPIETWAEEIEGNILEKVKAAR
jgi:spermidine/putrescine transport system substrate-binding protein